MHGGAPDGFSPGMGSRLVPSSIACFPVPGGIDALTILVENDEANAARCDGEVGERWTAEGREVLLGPSRRATAT